MNIDANNFREALKNIEKRDDVTIFLVSNVPTIVNGYKILRKGN